MNRRMKNNMKLDSIEVEEILSDKVQCNSRQYLVKWKNMERKSWVPIDFVCSLDALVDYYAKVIARVHVDYPILTLEGKANKLFQLFSEASTKKINEIVRSYLTIKGLRLPLSKRDQVIREFTKLVRFQIIPSNEKILQLREDTLLEKVLRLREQQLKNLKQRELEINIICDSEEAITLENEVNLEMFPEYFVYTNNYVPGAGVEIPNDPPIGCECSKMNGCASHGKENSSTMCCPDYSDTAAAYDENKRMVLEASSQLIYECNKKCTCDETCINRVVQNKSKVKLGIFMTFNHCGWGVRALQDIPKGTYVARYVGEVITFEEAKKRRTEYLFDIDFNYAAETDLCAFTVDAYKYGNITRFINHSCDPNLSVIGVMIDCLDPDLHELAFFAKRDIATGEELSFNYSKIMKCRCGSLKCKLKFKN